MRIVKVHMLVFVGSSEKKVEPPDGDAMRGLQIYDNFEVFNRGKRSLTLDLKHPDSKEIFRRLVEWADVHIHSPLDYFFNSTTRLVYFLGLRTLPIGWGAEWGRVEYE